MMGNRKVSRRDALRAGALGTVGLAAGAGGLSLQALGQGTAAQSPTQGSHHDMITVGQLAPGSFDPTRVPHPVRRRQRSPASHRARCCGSTSSSPRIGRSRWRPGCSTRPGPTTARCPARRSAAPRATGSGSASPTRAATRTASTSTGSTRRAWTAPSSRCTPAGASSTSSTPSRSGFTCITATPCRSSGTSTRASTARSSSIPRRDGRPPTRWSW